MITPFEMAVSSVRVGVGDERCDMKIVVVGGSGVLGSKLVATLGAYGHEVVAASRRSGVDAVTGAGLTEALRGAAVVVDVSNSPSFQDAAVMKFFKTSTHNLLTHGAAAGVGHHVALSVVGSGRFLKNAYFRAKLAQEKLIKESSIPYSIIKPTQFFEFVANIADAATHGNVVRLSLALRFNQRRSRRTSSASSRFLLDRPCWSAMSWCSMSVDVSVRRRTRVRTGRAH